MLYFNKHLHNAYLLQHFFYNIQLRFKETKKYFVTIEIKNK